MEEANVNFVSACNFQFHFLKNSVPGWEQFVILGVVDLRSVVVPCFYYYGSFFCLLFLFFCLSFGDKNPKGYCGDLGVVSSVMPHEDFFSL